MPTSRTPPQPEPTQPEPPQPGSPQRARDAPPSRRALDRGRGLLRRLVGHRLQRRTRWSLRVVIGGPLLLLLLVMLATRSPILGWVLARSVHAQFGARLEASRAVIDRWGRLDVRDFSLHLDRADDGSALPAEAGEFLSARRAVVDFSWRSLLTGSVDVRALELEEPVFRVSSTADGSSINLSSIRIPKGIAGAVVSAPRIAARAGAIEFGEHTLGPGGAYRRLNAIPVKGSLTPAGPNSTLYTIRLDQTAGLPGGPGGPETAPMAGVAPADRIFLEGSIDLAGTRTVLRLYNVSLDAWPAESVPEFVRGVWSRLNMQGKVALTEFTSSEEAGVRVDLTLEGIAMGALVPADRPEVAGEKVLNLAGVRGHIRFVPGGVQAELEGRIEDLPCRVTLTTLGRDLNSAVRCEIITEQFEVGKNPGLMPFMPPVVRDRFAIFSGPTALVDARVVLSRGPPLTPGQAGPPPPLSIDGSISFKNGRAAYHKFPYPIEDMSGLVRFDDEKVEIVNIKGRGPTGAILTANGLIAPPNESAELTVNVLALDVPVDDVLKGAIPHGRGRIVDALFNKGAYAALEARGMLISSAAAAGLTRMLGEAKLDAARARGAGADPAPASARVAELERRLAAPVFDLGGRASVDLRVHSGYGVNIPYTYVADVRFARAGLLPAKFPFPVNARDLLLRIDEDRATVRGAAPDTNAGLRGGRVDLSAEIPLDSVPGGPIPTIRVRARGVPVDDLLLDAIPERLSAGPGAVEVGQDDGTPGGMSIKRLLPKLRITGSVDCDAEILTRPAPSELGPDAPDDLTFEVAVGLRDLRLRPIEAAGAATLALASVSGTIHATERSIVAPDVCAQLELEPAAPGPGAPPLPPLPLTAFPMGTLEVAVRADLPADGSAGTPLAATLRAVDLDLAAPIEQLVGLLVPGSAGLLADLRAERRPGGLVDAVVTLERPAGAEAAVAVRAERLRAVSLDSLGGRLDFRGVEGAVVLDSSPVSRVGFERVAAEVLFNAEGVGRLGLTGSLPLAAGPGASVQPGDPEGVHADIRGGRFESGLVRELLRMAVPPGSALAREPLDPAGAFDAALDISPAPAGPGVGDAPRYGLSGSVSPRSLSLTRSGVRVEFPTVTGRVGFMSDGGTGAAASGRFVELQARAADWEASLDGPWSYTPGAGGEGGIGIDAAIAVTGERLGLGLTALLPGDVRAAIAKLELRLAGPFSMPDGRLTLIPAQAGTPGRTAFVATVRVAGASFDAGVPVRGLDGELAMSINRAEHSAADIELTLTGDRLWASGLGLQNLRAKIVSAGGGGGGSGDGGAGDGDAADGPARLVMPELSADCYGGRLAATAVFRPGAAAGGLPGLGEYQARVTLSGVRFAPVIGALATPPEADQPAGPPPPAPAPAPGGEDLARGVLDGTFALTGVPGDPLSRRGEGMLRVAGGDVVRMPFFMSMIALSNFQLPSSDHLDYLQAAFTLRGNRVEFGQLAALSRRLSILGSGTVTLPELALDLRFNSQSADRLPLLSDLVESLRDEIVSTHVTGTPDRPSVTTESFTGTRRIFTGLFEPGGAPEMDMGAVERAARAERERVLGRASGGPAAPVSATAPPPPRPPSRPPPPAATRADGAGPELR